jgi:hypothetical protein
MAAGPSLHQPHTLIFFLLALAFLVLATVVPMLTKRGRRWERRLAWTGILGTGASVFFAALPYWKQGIGVSLFVLAFLTAGAYAYTPYIKIRGKIYAFHVRDSLPDPPPDGAPAPGSDDPDYDPAPDSYSGSVTAQKFWWMMVLAMAMCLGCIIIPVADKPWGLIPGAAATVVLSAIAFGYGDASWGYPIARSQRIQFGVIAIITAGVFPVVYLGAYAGGKRWPLCRTNSLEYRAHQRHWKDGS